LARFNNVLLADSTCQKLPSNLAGIFASSSNQTGSVTATLRLQVIYNYSKSVFSYFDLGNYRENDQHKNRLYLCPIKHEKQRQKRYCFPF
jgi:hypothetical protein